MSADTPSSPAEPRPLTLPRVPVVPKICLMCGGTGYEASSAYLSCLSCKGTGLVPAPSSSGETPADWTCRALRSHGPCNTSNAADEALCGACGDARPTTADPRDAEIARLRAEVERWQAAFRNFGQHDETCSGPCSCGYSKLIRGLDQEVFADAAATSPAGDARGN